MDDPVGDWIGRLLILAFMVHFFRPEWSDEELIPDALFVVGVLVVLFGHPDYDD